MKWTHTCQAQSRNSRNTGDSWRSLELANADLVQRSPNEWPACSHSRSSNASNLYQYDTVISRSVPIKPALHMVRVINISRWPCNSQELEKCTCIDHKMKIKRHQRAACRPRISSHLWASCLIYARHIRAQAQGHVLIADWSLPLPLPISFHVIHDVIHDNMNDNMAASAHFGTRLCAFFYWTRFLENNVPFDNIPL